MAAPASDCLLKLLIKESGVKVYSRLVCAFAKSSEAFFEVAAQWWHLRDWRKAEAKSCQGFESGRRVRALTAVSHKYHIHQFPQHFTPTHSMFNPMQRSGTTLFCPKTYPSTIVHRGASENPFLSASLSLSFVR